MQDIECCLQVVEKYCRLKGFVTKTKLTWFSSNDLVARVTSSGLFSDKDTLDVLKERIELKQFVEDYDSELFYWLMS